MAQQPIENLEQIFVTIQTSFGRTQDNLTGSREERDIKRALRDNDDSENAMRIAGRYSQWYQENKINPLKQKLRSHYDNIVQGRPDGKTYVFKHAREKFVTRLTELLPYWNIPGLNLLGENQNNVDARRALVERLSAAIQNANGDERDRIADAFQLAVGLQALHINDEFVGFENPFDEIGNDRYKEWLCYLYLASVFYDREDILLPGNLTDKEVEDRVLQSFVGTLNDVIRGHNNDAHRWLGRPYHPENAPACMPGSIGRMMLNGANYHKDLTFSSFDPVYTDPTKSIEAAIINKAVRGLTEGTDQNSKDFLDAVLKLNFSFDAQGYDLLPFFDWNDQQKDELVEALAMDLINDWTSDMNEANKNSVINLHKAQIKAQLLPKVEAELAKYQKEEIEANDINFETWDRLTEAAFKKAFQNPVPKEIRNVFVKYNEIPCLMKIYYREKGMGDSLSILRDLENLPEMKGHNRPIYLDLLKQFIIVSGHRGIAALNDNEKVALNKILFDPEGLTETGVRATLIEKLDWAVFSSEYHGGLQYLLGVYWKSKILIPKNHSFVGALLESVLFNKKYDEFCKITKSLYTTNNFQQSCVEYQTIAKKAMKKRLLADFDGTGNYFLNFILTKEQPDNIIRIAKEQVIPGLLQELKDPNQNQIKDPIRKYLKLLKNVMVSGDRNILRDEDKVELRRVLLNPQGEDEQKVRTSFLKKISWVNLSNQARDLIDPNWKEQLIQNSIDLYLEQIFKGRKYTDFIQAITALETENNNPETKADFINKSLQKIEAALLTEFNQGKVDLLSFLLENQHLASSVMIQSSETITHFLSGLQPSDTVKFLNLISGQTTVQGKVNKIIVTHFSEDQMTALFDYFVVNQHLVDNPAEGTQKLGRAIDLLDFIYKQQEVDSALKAKAFQCMVNLLAASSNEDIDQNLRSHIEALVNEANKIVERQVSGKEAQLLYDSLSAGYRCIKEIEGYEEFYAHAMRGLNQKSSFFPWAKMVGCILVGLFLLALPVIPVVIGIVLTEFLGAGLYLAIATLFSLYVWVLPSYQEEFTYAINDLTENSYSSLWVKVIGYILLGFLALALLAVATVVVAALLNPGGLALGFFSSAAILSTIGTLFAESAAVFTGLMATISGFIGSILGTATTATVVVGTVSTFETVGAIVTGGAAGITGLLTASGVGFFATRDIQDTNSKKEVKNLIETIHEETVGPRNGVN